MSQRRMMWAAVACLLLLFAQTVFASRQLSLTYDEPIYTAIGYADLTTGDVRWHSVIGHPPLVNLLTAWPLLLDSAHPDARQISSWGTGDSLGFSRALIAQFDSLERLALVTRLPVIWLTLLLAAFVYRWAQQAWGGTAGLLALGLFAFDPNIIAHGQLNTTDMGVTAFGFMGCYALARYLRRPSLATYLGAGLGLGAAIASKTSGLFLVGAFGLVLFSFWLTSYKKDLRGLGVWLVKLTGLGGLALLVLWAAYLFEMQPLDSGGLPVPAASHWEGLSYQRSNVSIGQTTFLAGRLVSGGHWSYFPIALLVKTPLPEMIGFLAALALSLRHGAGPRWSTIPLIVTPLVYLIVAMLISLNIGHRHVLPILPFLFIFTSRIANGGSRITNHVSRFILYTFIIWHIVGTLHVFPHYLAYFNELAGGPDGGYRYLADSSVDWGQGLKALERYLGEQQIETVRLAAFSSLDPALYDLRFEPFPPTVGAPITLTSRFDPQPGVYAISAVPLQGVWMLDPDTYDWFRHREPMARVGHAIFIYEVSPTSAPSWVAQCAPPLPPLDSDKVAEGFGRPDLRLAVFDCEQSWLYPAGKAGWTILPGDRVSDDWTSERLAGAYLSFHQGEFWSHPALTIYAQPESPVEVVPSQADGRGAPSDWPLDKAVIEGVAVTAPVDTVGPLTFLGYEIQDQSQVIELHTYWRVDEVPARPLSLMAHLLAADGTTAAVGDGLGVPIEVWQPGDVIVQRHHLNISQSSLPGLHWVQTGAYWLDTMERWPIVINGQPVGDRLLLAEVSR
ncbi:MAG: glycosyltransferase family 39 protein [Chloroflexota bacterium]|nr:glycosyltransferase family 39 protein [Chloroflexota bacterium]